MLSPIWLTKPETRSTRPSAHGNGARLGEGRRLPHGRQSCGGRCSRSSPVKPNANSITRRCPYAEVPAFVARLRSSDHGMIARLAFEFLILTAARTGEVIGAMQGEIDEALALWTIPAERMKAGREHRVPLSSRAMGIVQEAKLLAAGSDHVFPGRTTAKPMSNMVFLMTLRRMNMPITAHGFRSAFRDWAAETTNIPREVAEMALAHAVENRVEAAYRRGDLLEKRRDLMGQWAVFVDPPTIAD